jgi:hypothetical protein
MNISDYREKDKTFKNVKSKFKALKYLKEYKNTFLKHKNINNHKNNLKIDQNKIKKKIRNISLEEIDKYAFQNITPKEISLILAIDYSVVYRRLQKIRKLNLLEGNIYKRKVFKKEFIPILSELMERNESKIKRIKDIKIEFENQLKNVGIYEEFSKNTYYQKITSKKFLNFTFKEMKKYTLYYKNDIDSKLDRRNYCRLLLYYKSQGYRFIFVDESGINESMHAKRGWGKRGNKLMLNHKVFKKEKNISILASIGEDQMLLYQLFEGQLSHQTSFLLF